MRVAKFALITSIDQAEMGDTQKESVRKEFEAWLRGESFLFIPPPGYRVECCELDALEPVKSIPKPTFIKNLTDDEWEHVQEMFRQKGEAK